MLCPRQPQLISQDLEQGRVGLNHRLISRAIHGELYNLFSQSFSPFIVSAFRND